MKKVRAPSGEKEDQGEEPMSPAARLFHQPRFNCFIIVMMGIGKRIDVETIKAGLQATLIRHPRFSSIKVVDGGDRKPRWVRTEVAVEDHVVVPDLDSDLIESPDRFVEDYVSGLSRAGTLPVDSTRPLWELHLLNIRTSEAEAVAVLRIHHSLGDGISLMSLLLASTRKVSDPDSLPTLPGAGRTRPATAPRGKEEVEGRRWWWWWWALSEVIVAMWGAVRVAWNTAVDVILFVATSVFLRDSVTSVTGRAGVGSNPKRFVHRTISLDDVKAVKNAMNSTVNDVLLGVTYAGLNRYLTGRYEDEGQNKNKHVPRNIRMRSTVLVNIRPVPGIHALADMMEQGKSDSKWGNCLGYIILRFPVTECDDPLDYVRQAKAIAKRKKSSLGAIFTYTSGNLIVKVLGIKTAAALCYRMLSHTTLSFSNVLGPIEEVQFYGHRIVYLAPSVHGHPHALTIHFQSYVDKMKLVLAVDESIIPDPHKLCEDLVESLKQIKDAAVNL